MRSRGHTAGGQGHSIYEVEAVAKAGCNEAKPEAVIFRLGSRPLRGINIPA